MALAKKDLQVDEAPMDQLAEYFYKITNHPELYKIGKGLLAEKEKGIKNFAFTSTGYKNSQQKSVLGLCCFFDQNTSYKIAIVSDHLSQGVFHALVEAAEPNSYRLGTDGEMVNYRSFYHHFDFIDYKEFQTFYESSAYTKNFDSQVENVLSHYDIVLWDIPEMETMKKHSLFHSRMSRFYESMTVIVAQNTTSGKQVEFIKKFFSNYNINLNGVLFDTSDSPEKPKRKKLLGLFG